MSHIKQVYPLLHGMPEGYVAVRIPASLLRSSSSSAMDGGAAYHWIVGQGINPLDVTFSVSERDARLNAIGYDVWFEPQHRNAALRFKLTFGGAA